MKNNLSREKMSNFHHPNHYVMQNGLVIDEMIEQGRIKEGDRSSYVVDRKNRVVVKSGTGLSYKIPDDWNLGTWSNPRYDASHDER